MLRSLFHLGTVLALAGALSACGVQLKKLDTTESASEASVPCDSAGSPFGGGSGIASDPYALCSPAHVQNLASALSASFVVARDIDFSSVSSWTPIGSDALPFTGTLDGNSKTFRNLTLSLAGAADTEWVGLFQTIGAGATVRDLELDGFSVAGNNMTGVLAGHVAAATISDITISNATVNTRAMGGGIAGRIDSVSTVTRITIDGILVSSAANGSLCGSTYDTGVGALFGRTSGLSTATTVRITGADVRWSATGVNISGWTHVGGIVGYTGSLELSDAEFEGSVDGGASSTGGVAGQWDGNSLTGAGSITDVHLSDTHVTSTTRAGGIAGNWNRRMHSGVSPALRVSFQGTVHGGTHAGGFAGIGNFGNIEKISIKADVTGVNYVGGLFGYLIFAIDNGGIKDALFTGSVTGLNAASSDYLAGVAGVTHGGVAQLVSNVVVAATITNPFAGHAFTYADFGNLNAGSTTSGIYYRSSTMGALTPIRASALSDAQMIDSTQFAGFDFTGAWAMPSTSAYTGIASPVPRFMCGRSGIVCP
jgi:hypothetical protein